MNESTIYEQYYQAWIKRNLNKILLGVLSIVFIALATETYHHIQNKHQLQAQALFEQYFDHPNSQQALTLIVQYPNHIQTHLVLFSEAKLAYDNEKFDTAIQHLNFIRTHSKEEAIQKIACYRLAHIYLQQDLPKKAHAILSGLDEDAYTQLQLALTLSDPDQKSDALNKALSLSESPYLNNMIATAQNDIIEP